MIEFVVDKTKEVKQGIITKISGKGEKTKVCIEPIGKNHEEIWKVSTMADNSLKVIKE